jgi:hypothetical protein
MCVPHQDLFHTVPHFFSPVEKRGGVLTAMLIIKCGIPQCQRDSLQVQEMLLTCSQKVTDLLHLPSFDGVVLVMRKRNMKIFIFYDYDCGTAGRYYFL